MVVDSKNNFITARAHPELLHIIPTVKSAILTLKHAEYEPLHVNLAEVSNKLEFSFNYKLIKTQKRWDK